METTTITIYEYISQLKSIIYTQEQVMANPLNDKQYEEALNIWTTTAEHLFAIEMELN